MDVAQVRAERDLLGEVAVPAGARYGAATARALANFELGGPTLGTEPGLLRALAQVKAATARANTELGVLPADVGDAIVRAAREVAAGRWHEHFPLPVLQGGGGTSTHMNMNEVLAHRAGELLGPADGRRPVDAHDHVNRGQSTNDVMPAALALAVVAAARETLDGLAYLRAGLLDLAARYPGLDHLGRTCLQDAVPLPVAAGHRAQAYAVARAADDLRVATDRLLAVPLGGTAVGTGLGAADGFAALAVRHLRAETGLDVRAGDPYDGLASLEPYAAVADAAARAGRTAARIAGDLRLLASGPAGGIGEVALPPVQAGSSIMPGKVNPVLPELVVQVSFQLAGTAHVVGLAAGAGELEVTPWAPVVTAELLPALRRLGRVAVAFTDRCLAGLAWRTDRVAANLRGSLQDAVEAAAEIGYDRAARDVHERRAQDTGGHRSAPAGAEAGADPSGAGRQPKEGRP